MSPRQIVDGRQSAQRPHHSPVRLGLGSQVVKSKAEHLTLRYDWRLKSPESAAQLQGMINDLAQVGPRLLHCQRTRGPFARCASLPESDAPCLCRHATSLPAPLPLWCCSCNDDVLPLHCSSHGCAPAHKLPPEHGSHTHAHTTLPRLPAPRMQAEGHSVLSMEASGEMLFVEMSTPAVGGPSMNDFALAAKVRRHERAARQGVTAWCAWLRGLQADASQCYAVRVLLEMRGKLGSGQLKEELLRSLVANLPLLVHATPLQVNELDIKDLVPPPRKKFWA